MYPIAGIFLALATSDANLLPMIFPLMSGFALIGPIAAIGLYEISRRREAGLDTSWKHALEVRHSPALPSIIVGRAACCSASSSSGWWQRRRSTRNLFGDVFPRTIGRLSSRRSSARPQGMQLIIWGNLIGFVFAIVVLATTVVTFPLLLDRDVGAVAAMAASIRATIVNPVPVLLWGLIVAALPRHRHDPDLCRACAGHADPRACDLASLSQAGRAGLSGNAVCACNRHAGTCEPAFRVIRDAVL